MGSLVNSAEYDDYVVYRENCYSPDMLHRCREAFEKLCEEGKVKGKFMDPKWYCYSDITHFSISFEFDIANYMQHMYKQLHISVDEMHLILRCFAVSQIGVFIYKSICNNLTDITRLLSQTDSLEDKKYAYDKLVIRGFLTFAGIPDKIMKNVLNGIRNKVQKAKNQRELADMISYLAVENEINQLFGEGGDEDAMLKYFPIFFWVNVTFTLPLRATEMLITPFHCLSYDGDDVYLQVRRTRLKKRTRTVTYDVDKDYKICEYKIPHTRVVDVIEWYQLKTRYHKRRFLFDYKYNVDEMFALRHFNELLREFMEVYLIGNKKYDFARYASGIEEFEIVTAGDSRPIAMSNLYFSGAGADVCRQLAQHERIAVSSGYYTNISKTLLNSSIMRIQKKIYAEQTQQADASKRYGDDLPAVVAIKCMSPKRRDNPENLDDCIVENHLQECFGCRYYVPSAQEIEEYCGREKERVEATSKAVLEYLEKLASIKGKDTGDLEQLFLQAQTAASRFRRGYDLMMEEKGKEWMKIHGTKNVV